MKIILRKYIFNNACCDLNIYFLRIMFVLLYSIYYLTIHFNVILINLECVSSRFTGCFLFLWYKKSSAVPVIVKRQPRVDVYICEIGVGICIDFFMTV